MSQDSCWPVQAGVYARLGSFAPLTALLASGASGVYDHVPPGSAFPYIVLGMMRAEPFETQRGGGYDIVLEVQSYSRALGMKEARGLMEAVASALHDETFPIEGQRLVFCRLVAQESRLSPDGETRTGSQRFRLLTEPLEGE
ncbi:MAG TPA: DUF3168 domain-containing protein [Patescibacteria group bacterium]|nr:DUF3168 domain-containing protein [Patescibacteria group bacterium]